MRFEKLSRIGEAREIAAQIWCRPENGKRTMDVAFAESIAKSIVPVLKQRDNWRAEAHRYAQNASR